MATKLVNIFIACLLGLAITACVKEQASQSPAPTTQQVEPEPSQEPDPRALASLQLTEQGRRLVEAGKSDQAIRVLEQAISLNPDNGENYYYLAEAWLLKGIMSEAKKFNQLAEIHLKENSQWMERVIQQANQIAESEK
jgi:tetratricopeptide (TPR) repeat protein